MVCISVIWDIISSNPRLTHSVPSDIYVTPTPDSPYWLDAAHSRIYHWLQSSVLSRHPARDPDKHPTR